MKNQSEFVTGQRQFGRGMHGLNTVRSYIIAIAIMVCSIFGVGSIFRIFGMPGCSVAAYAAETYIIDEVGLLSDQIKDELSKDAREIAREFGCGVYIVVVEDFYEYGHSMESAAIELYESNQLGLGETKNGYLLFMSMAERDYWMLVHGDKANRAFTDYGMEKVEGQFLDDFRYDDWEQGFFDYQEMVKKLLVYEKKGKPYDVDSDPMVVFAGGLISLVISILVGFGVTAVLKSGMKQVVLAKNARNFVAREDGIVYRVQNDRYRYTSTSKVYSPRPKESSSSGGRSGGGGGGYRGSGGKF